LQVGSRNQEYKDVKKLEELEFFSLKMRRIRENLIVIFSYLMGGCKEDGARLFPEMNCEMTRDNRHNLQQEKFDKT